MVLSPEQIERNPDGTPKGWPCCGRTFPDPDPMERFIDPDEVPALFRRLPKVEQSRRLRAYLLTRASGEIPEMAWLAVSFYDPETIALVHDLVDTVDDRHIESVIARGERERRAREFLRQQGLARA